jgi:hypothetical protein
MAMNADEHRRDVDEWYQGRIKRLSMKTAG